MYESKGGLIPACDGKAAECGHRWPRSRQDGTPSLGRELLPTVIIFMLRLNIRNAALNGHLFSSKEIRKGRSNIKLIFRFQNAEREQEERKKKERKRSGKGDENGA